MARKGRRNKVKNVGNTYTTIDAKTLSLAIAEALAKRSEAKEQDEEQEED